MRLCWVHPLVSQSCAPQSSHEDACVQLSHPPLPEAVQLTSSPLQTMPLLHSSAQNAGRGSQGGAHPFRTAQGSAAHPFIQFPFIQRRSCAPRRIGAQHPDAPPQAVLRQLRVAEAQVRRRAERDVQALFVSSASSSHGRPDRADPETCRRAAQDAVHLQASQPLDRRVERASKASAVPLSVHRAHQPYPLQQRGRSVRYATRDDSFPRSSNYAATATSRPLFGLV